MTNGRKGLITGALCLGTAFAAAIVPVMEVKVTGTVWGGSFSGQEDGSWRINEAHIKTKQKQDIAFDVSSLKIDPVQDIDDALMRPCTVTSRESVLGYLWKERFSPTESWGRAPYTATSFTYDPAVPAP